MVAARRSSGRKALRIRKRLSSNIAHAPAAITAASRRLTGELTVAGDSTRASPAATSTAAFVRKVRQKSGTALGACSTELTEWTLTPEQVLGPAVSSPS